MGYIVALFLRIYLKYGYNVAFDWIGLEKS